MQKERSVAFKIRQNAFPAGPTLRNPLGELKTFPRPACWMGRRHDSPAFSARHYNYAHRFGGRGHCRQIFSSTIAHSRVMGYVTLISPVALPYDAHVDFIYLVYSYGLHMASIWQKWYGALLNEYHMKFIWQSRGIHVAICHITSLILTPYVTHMKIINR